MVQHTDRIVQNLLKLATSRSCSTSRNFLVLWEECVLLQDTEVSGPNSISFLPNSVLLVFLYDKTWSSVSNSSLSKTFALCQFRKLKAQKLCFLPPNIVLGLKRNESKNYFPTHLFSNKQRIDFVSIY